MAPVKTRLIPSRSFFRALPHREAKSNIGRKLSWGKGGKNTIWMQREAASPNSIGEMPVRRPRCAPESFCASPFCTPSPSLPFIALYPSCTAQHMHTKYIKRAVPVPKYGVVYIRGSYEDEKEECHDWFAFARVLDALSCFTTTLTLRLYAFPRSQNDQTVST